MTTLNHRTLSGFRLTPKQAGLIHHLGELKARFSELESQKPETLKTLRLSAMVESTESSNRIEGIVTTRKRLEAMLLCNAAPQNREEKEILGYRDALNLIHENHGTIPLNLNVILQFHSMLYRQTDTPGGFWKKADNVIRQVNPDGTHFVRFRPVPAFQTPKAMETLIEESGFARQDGLTPLLAIPFFILDFLCIHPFMDGNGRVSRLLNLLLLYHAGFNVGRYISLERTVEKTKGDYYEALFAGSQGWHESKHALEPWLDYNLGVLARAYHELEQRAKNVKTLRGAKTELARQIILELWKPFAFSELQSRCPGVSAEQLKNVLQQLKAEGALRLQGRGRGARWMRTFEAP